MRRLVGILFVALAILLPWFLLSYGKYSQLQRTPGDVTAIAQTLPDLDKGKKDQFAYLRRVAQKCLSQITHDDLRRDLNRLIAHCDRKIDQCHTLGS